MKGFYVLIYLIYTLDVSTNLDLSSIFFHFCVATVLIAENTSCFKTWTLTLKGGC